MHTMVPKALIAVLTVSTHLFDLVSAALAGPEVNVTQGWTLAGTGLALRGDDPVVYFTEGRPVMGQATYAAVHSGATSRCATQAPSRPAKRSQRRMSRTMAVSVPTGWQWAHSSTETPCSGRLETGNCPAL